MKKYIKILYLFLFGFFFYFGFESYSAKEVNISFDHAEHFNFFYEQKNNTTFYKEIISKGDTIYEYVCSLYSAGCNSGSYVSFFTYDDFVSLGGLNGSSKNSSPNLTNAKFAIVFSQNFPSYAYDAGTGLYSISITPSSFGYSSVIIDENFNVLDAYYYGSTSLKFKISATEDDFQYLLSAFFIADSSVMLDSSKFGTFSSYSSSLGVLTVGTFSIDEEFMSLDSISYKGFLGNWVYDIFHKNDVDPGIYGLSYFKLNYLRNLGGGVYGYIHDLYYYLTYDSSKSLSVPDNFTSVAFTFENNYYLIPKYISDDSDVICSSDDYLLYFTTTNINSVNILGYGLSSNMSLTHNYTFKIGKANSVYYLNLNSILANDSTIIDNFYLISSSDNIAVNNLYYNPNCYITHLVGSSELSFENAITGETVVLGTNSQIIHQNENAEYSEVVSNNSSDDSATISLTNLVSDLWNNCTNFISAGKELINLSTVFFLELPAEVRSVILLIFTISGLVLLINILKNIIS